MSDEIDMEYTTGEKMIPDAARTYADTAGTYAEFVPPDTTRIAEMTELYRAACADRDSARDLFVCANAAKRQWRQTSNWWACRWQRDIDIDNRLQADIDDAHKQIDALESKLNVVRAERDAAQADARALLEKTSMTLTGI